MGGETFLEEIQIKETNSTKENIRLKGLHRHLRAGIYSCDMDIRTNQYEIIKKLQSDYTTDNTCETER